MSNYSTELSKILQNKQGYRIESYSGSGICDVEEVIRFEMGELENRDISNFCQMEYNLIFEEDAFEEWLRALLVVLRAKLNTDNVFLLWLTRKEDVSFYCDEGTNWILRYTLPENAIPISDLGSEGALFALDTHPDFLDIQVEEVHIEK